MLRPPVTRPVGRTGSVSEILLLGLAAFSPWMLPAPLAGAQRDPRLAASGRAAAGARIVALRPVRRLVVLSGATRAARLIATDVYGGGAPRRRALRRGVRRYEKDDGTNEEKTGKSRRRFMQSPLIALSPRRRSRRRTRPPRELLPLPRFVELKLASGMTAPHRLHDLADVLNLVRSAKLPADFALQLHPWVRQKFRELWDAAQSEDPD